ncbi:major facilitator superfamily transporter [Colletotrichum sojae]|uniref:Major facilitator superfamily transporter n=1 Tax=Colletotrichum sojae TaxID=2175907 RepID=A0A8H6JIW7_9PEZI|nr:major facilitator superfamily transporter [Colletotrichum sojae]
MSTSAASKDFGKYPQVDMLDDPVKPNQTDHVVIGDREVKERRLVRRIDIRIV